MLLLTPRFFPYLFLSLQHLHNRVFYWFSLTYLLDPFPEVQKVKLNTYKKVKYINYFLKKTNNIVKCSKEMFWCEIIQPGNKKSQTQLWLLFTKCRKYFYFLCKLGLFNLLLSSPSVESKIHWLRSRLFKSRYLRGEI